MGALVGNLSGGSVITASPKSTSTISAISIVNRDAVAVNFTVYIITKGSTSSFAITPAPVTLSPGQAYIRELTLISFDTNNQIRIESSGSIDYHFSISP